MLNLEIYFWIIIYNPVLLNSNRAQRLDSYLQPNPNIWLGLTLPNKWTNLWVIGTRPSKVIPLQGLLYSPMEYTPEILHIQDMLKERNITSTTQRKYQATMLHSQACQEANCSSYHCFSQIKKRDKEKTILREYERHFLFQNKLNNQLLVPQMFNRQNPFLWVRRGDPVS